LIQIQRYNQTYSRGVLPVWRFHQNNLWGCVCVTSVRYKDRSSGVV